MVLEYPEIYNEKKNNVKTVFLNVDCVYPAKFDKMGYGSNGTNFSKPLESSTNSYTNSETILFYVCFIFVFLPGLVTNSLALVFILKDVRKVVFPAIVLLIALISSDLVADIFTGIHMGVALYVTETGFAICAPLGVFHTFFRLYSAALNAMMSVDRVLAICAPYFYKRYVHVYTWKTGCFLTAFFAGGFSLFPAIGLGDVTSQRYQNGKMTYVCSTFSYREEPHKKIYSAMYGVLGCVIILIIVCGNSLVIHSIFKMKKRVHAAPVELSTSTTTALDSNSSSTNVTSFEVAFAKLMGCLALVYLLCCTPKNVLILVELVRPVTNPSLKGMIHFLSGLSYSVDPIVYILIRKTARSRISRWLRCRCSRQDRNELSMT